MKVSVSEISVSRRRRRRRWKEEEDAREKGDTQPANQVISTKLIGINLGLPTEGERERRGKRLS